jgi:plasmid stabilization system protein ParE
VGKRRVEWTDEGRKTLDEILDHVALESRQGALLILEQVLTTADSLDILAERGRVVPEVGDPKVREVFVFRYRLMYHVAEEAVSVLAVIHGARDFERWRKSQ